MKQFEVGKRYFHNFITQSDLVVEYEVLSRTEKTIQIQNIHTKQVIRKKIGTLVINDTEIIYPLGKYSMCPTLKASNEL